MIKSRKQTRITEAAVPPAPPIKALPRLAIAAIPETRVAVRHENRFRRYLSCLRTEEILLLQGPPFFGAVFALRDLSVKIILPMAILAIANLLLMAHVFLINDWSGLTGDLEDPNKAASVFAARGVGRKAVARISAGLVAASLALFGYLGRDMLLLAAAIAMLSALYSLPRFNLKGRPVFNSVAHLTGGILHFLLGYSLFSTIDGRGIAIAMFFALTFVAGHLTQEVRDRDGDSLNGIGTNAVIFGSRRTFLAGLIVFGLAYAVLVGMAVGGILPLPLAAMGFLYFIHLRWSLRTLREDLSYASIVKLQGRYRALYSLIGLSMIVALSLTISASHP